VVNKLEMTVGTEVGMVVVDPNGVRTETDDGVGTDETVSMSGAV
jgi:hypothetical protein